MGNCANKPATTEGEAPAPEQKPTVVDREIEVEQNKVTTGGDDDHTKAPSLGQMLEEEEKKPEGEVTTKPAEEKPSEPAKLIEEVTKDVAVIEPAKPEVSEPRKEEPSKPAQIQAVTPTTTDEKKVNDKK